MRDLTSFMFSCLGGKSQLRVPAAVLVSASCFPEEGTVGDGAGAGAAVPGSGAEAAVRGCRGCRHVRALTSDGGGVFLATFAVAHHFSFVACPRSEDREVSFPFTQEKADGGIAAWSAWAMQGGRTRIARMGACCLRAAA